MTTRGVDSVQMGFMGRMGWGYEKYLEGLGSLLVFEVGDCSKIIFWHDICVMWGEACVRDASVIEHLRSI
jgi:hypothetical protein